MLNPGQPHRPSEPDTRARSAGPAIEPSDDLSSLAPPSRPIEGAGGAVTAAEGAVAAVAPERGSVLDLDEAERQYLDRLRAVLEPFGASYVQECDEGRRPPLEVLRAVIDSGSYVTSVPLPERADAAAAFEALRDAGVFPPGKAERIERMIESEPSASEAETLSRIAGSGRARSMSLSSMEIAKLTGVGIGTFLGVSSGLSAHTIDRIADPSQRSLWLNALHTGIFTYGFGLTEPGAGSDPRSMSTTFRRETDEAGNVSYVLNGSKKFIGNAARVESPSGDTVHGGADFLFVYAVDDPAKPPAERTYRAFAVPRGRIGEENVRHSGGAHNKMGLREVNNGDFELKEVRVPGECLLGDPAEDVYPKMLGLLDVTRLYVGAMGAGTAEAALSIARRYAAERVQNSRPIEEYQLVSFPLQDLEARALAGKLLVLDAAERVDRAVGESEELSASISADRRRASLAVESLERHRPKLDPALSALLESGSSRLLSALERAEGSLKPREAKAEVPAALAEIARATRALRDLYPDGPERTEVKAAYKELLAVQRSVEAWKEPSRFGTETAMAKLFNTELAETACRQAIDTLGGTGYMEDPAVGFGLAKRSRDAKVLTIYEGTSNVQRNIISQGVFLKELKEIGSDVRKALQHWLLSCDSTKRICYAILKSASHSPLARADAAYKYALADVMTRYNDALRVVEAKWKRDGVPERYAGWDARSLEREQNLLASLPVQARMGILADIATERKLLQLAVRERARLDARGGLGEDEEKRRETLAHFESIAVERIVELGRKLGSKTLLEREEKHLRRWS